MSSGGTRLTAIQERHQVELAIERENPEASYDLIQHLAQERLDDWQQASDAAWQEEMEGEEEEEAFLNTLYQETLICDVEGLEENLL